MLDAVLLNYFIASTLRGPGKFSCAAVLVIVVVVVVGGLTIKHFYDGGNPVDDIIYCEHTSVSILIVLLQALCIFISKFSC